jgi:hypothetical protein
MEPTGRDVPKAAAAGGTMNRRRFLAVLASGLTLLSVRKIWATPAPLLRGYFWRRDALNFARRYAAYIVSDFTIPEPEPSRPLGVTSITIRHFHQPPRTIEYPVSRLLGYIVDRGVLVGREHRRGELDPSYTFSIRQFVAGDYDLALTSLFEKSHAIGFEAGARSAATTYPDKHWPPFDALYY